MPSGGARRLEILAALTIVGCLGWAIAGLIFRFVIYSSMPVAPGEPYGEADVFELIHHGALLLLCGGALLEGVLLLLPTRFQLRRLGAFLCLVGVVLPLAYQPVHAWVAALAER
jgi:hypothetical protein